MLANDDILRAFEPALLEIVTSPDSPMNDAERALVWDEFTACSRIVGATAENAFIRYCQDLRLSVERIETLRRIYVR